jgi:hypothetical protein
MEQYVKMDKAALKKSLPTSRRRMQKSRRNIPGLKMNTMLFVLRRHSIKRILK